MTAEEYIEQKSVDKIEPKFKVGDFIANDYCRGKVVELTNDAYLLDTGQGMPFSYEHNIHLWTIKDAKDGDVLIYDNGWICIFKCIHGVWYSSYCFITADGEFNLGYEEHSVDSTINGNVKPATKEHRNQLEKAMANAGYKWDVNKKELIKL